MTRNEEIRKAGEERAKLLKQQMQEAKTAVTKALRLAIENDPILKKEVEAGSGSDDRGWGGRASQYVQFKKGRVNDSDRGLHNRVATLEWRSGSGYGSIRGVIVRQSGWHATKISHATYKFRKDKTVNVDKIVERVIGMAHNCISYRDANREARKERKSNMNVLAKKYPDWTFDNNREFQVGGTYSDRILVNANWDHELSVDIKLRNLSEQEVKDLIAYVEDHRKKAGLDD